jgi:hypothetical protein
LQHAGFVIAHWTDAQGQQRRRGGSWLYRVTHDDPRAMFLFVLRETVTFDVVDSDLNNPRTGL